MCSAVVCYNSTWWLSSAGLHLTALSGLWSQCWFTAMAQFFSLITLHLSHTHSNPTCLLHCRAQTQTHVRGKHYPEQINHSLFALTTFKLMCKVPFKPSRFLLVNKDHLYEQLKHEQTCGELSHRIMQILIEVTEFHLLRIHYWDFTSQN